MTPELPFDAGLAGDLARDLGELLEEIDAALDASFLGDLAAAFDRAASAGPGPGASAALS